MADAKNGGIGGERERGRSLARSFKKLHFVPVIARYVHSCGIILYLITLYILLQASDIIRAENLQDNEQADFKPALTKVSRQERCSKTQN